jgi:hypothetical protein
MEHDDFALLAVIDAYKWWISTDYGFLRLTGAIDGPGGASEHGLPSIDATRLRRIAKAYSVSRNIPTDGDDSQAQKIVDLFTRTPGPELSSTDLLTRAKALAELSRKSPVYVRRSDGELSQRQLASAFSKLSWFIQPRGWTMFDRYVGLAVIGREGAGLKQMAAFYEKLAPNWKVVSDAVCDTAEQAGFHPLLGYRIIDKYLFCHGLAISRVRGRAAAFTAPAAASVVEAAFFNPTVNGQRSSLNWTLEALGEPVSTRLRTLAGCVGETLSELPVHKVLPR